MDVTIAVYVKTPQSDSTNVALSKSCVCVCGTMDVTIAVYVKTPQSDSTNVALSKSRVFVCDLSCICEDASVGQYKCSPK